MGQITHIQAHAVPHFSHKLLQTVNSALWRPSGAKDAGKKRPLQGTLNTRAYGQENTVFGLLSSWQGMIQKRTLTLYSTAPYIRKHKKTVVSQLADHREWREMNIFAASLRLDDPLPNCVFHEFRPRV